MKRVISIILCLIIALSGIGASIENTLGADVIMVYIAASGKGKTYHDEGCRYAEKPITLEEAHKQGLTPCKQCKPPYIDADGNVVEQEKDSFTERSQYISEGFDPRNIELETVLSTCFSEIGYDETEQVLVVHFCHGGLYAYYQITEEDYSALMNAESLGTYYNQEIKGQFPCEKLGYTRSLDELTDIYGPLIDAIESGDYSAAEETLRDLIPAA